MPDEPDERITEHSTQPAAGSKLPPFKRGELPALASPLVSLRPSGDSDVALDEAPSTLLFNDVSDDAMMCDPNDPDCEVV